MGKQATTILKIFGDGIFFAVVGVGVVSVVADDARRGELAFEGKVDGDGFFDAHIAANFNDIVFANKAKHLLSLVASVDANEVDFLGLGAFLVGVFGASDGILGEANAAVFFNNEGLLERFDVFAIFLLFIIIFIFDIHGVFFVAIFFFAGIFLDFFDGGGFTFSVAVKVALMEVAKAGSFFIVGFAEIIADITIVVAADTALTVEILASNGDFDVEAIKANGGSSFVATDFIDAFTSSNLVNSMLFIISFINLIFVDDDNQFVVELFEFVIFFLGDNFEFDVLEIFQGFLGHDSEG